MADLRQPNADRDGHTMRHGAAAALALSMAAPAEVQARPELSLSDRSLVTLSVLIATGKTAQLSGHLGRGLSNGLKPSEVAGMVTQLALSEAVDGKSVTWLELVTDAQYQGPE